MNKLLQKEAERLIEIAFAEDVPYRDLASEAVFNSKRAEVDLIAKQDGIICGLEVFQMTFEYLDPTIEIEYFCKEGDTIIPGDKLLTVKGPAATLLIAERTALNFLQRLSGVATASNKLVNALKDTGIKVVDTRKTTPAYRNLQKYAVRVGGAYNHRYGLSDLIMLKDNHIQAAGGIKQAVAAVKEIDPFMHKIEIEVENLEMVKEALEAGVDIIMLDNMDHDTMKTAIEIIDGQCLIEASGNLSIENAHTFSDLKIDFISSGALTHSAGILDLSMKNFRIID